MKYWDASALAPLVWDDSHTPVARSIRDSDAGIVTWWGSVVECASAIARRQRNQGASHAREARLHQALADLRVEWNEIPPGERLREHAMRLLRVHHLSAADALQLAAAIEWAGAPSGRTFVSFDARLNEAAAREGFETVTDARRLASARVVVDHPPVEQ
jgi:predicted nucleic acid-binding protein